MSLYVGLAVLEDSGYMARAALVMDRVMSPMGLQGKSFLPMLLGFGCTVPAFYATRTLEDEKDRLLTGLLVPFMSCGARLPVYVLFATIFFPGKASMVIFALYLSGVLIALLLGFALRGTIFRQKEATPLLMELPPYRLPTLRGIWFYTWQRTSEFITNAVTIILVASIVVWLLMAIPVTGGGTFTKTSLDNSAFAMLADGISPALAPLGFGSWETGGALVTGFVAKEVVVSTLAQAYNVGPDAEQIETTTFVQDIGYVVTGFLRATVDTVKSIPLIVGINLFDEQEASHPPALITAIRDRFDETSNGKGALAGLAFMVFVLLYTPCAASLAAERQVLGTNWMLYSIFGQLILAWMAAFLVFNIGKLVGVG
jgi:ferrous iron transport protein B